MPTESPYNLSEGCIYISGCETKGIPEFTCDQATSDEAIHKSMTYSPTETILTINCHFNWYLYLKLIGVYDWVLNNCPNKRVVHLARFGRTQRVRNKNFRRAWDSLGKEIDG